MLLKVYSSIMCNLAISCHFLDIFFMSIFHSMRQLLYWFVFHTKQQWCAGDELEGGGGERVKMVPHISSNFPSTFWKCAEKYKSSEARLSISIYLWRTV